MLYKPWIQFDFLKNTKLKKKQHQIKFLEVLILSKELTNLKRP